MDADKSAALRRLVLRRPGDLERLDLADLHSVLLLPPAAKFPASSEFPGFSRESRKDHFAAKQPAAAASAGHAGGLRDGRIVDRAYTEPQRGSLDQQRDRCSRQTMMRRCFIFLNEFELNPVATTLPYNVLKPALSQDCLMINSAAKD
jgi:hypothetical protein